MPRETLQKRRKRALEHFAKRIETIYNAFFARVDKLNPGWSDTEKGKAILVESMASLGAAVEVLRDNYDVDFKKGKVPPPDENATQPEKPPV